MKKKTKLVYILAILLTISLIHNIGFAEGKDDVNNKSLKEIYSKFYISKKHMPKEGIVTDSKVAIDIGKVVLKNVFKNSISSKALFDAKYYKKYDLWRVSTSDHPNEISTGGVRNVLIQKSDGKVISVWGTK